MTHKQLGHAGLDRTVEAIRRNYCKFSKLNKKVRRFLSNCLKCITYSPKDGKQEGYLHCIPKGNKPFICIHINHYSPLSRTRMKNKFIFLIVDGYSKFVKLYAC
ncbi:MAG: integrase zinc binding domain-containing protein, partial [Rickettsiaceae bacterium]|nr:integrase zinc binding domain-containing protein [Rickettsiaceae bacterium]